MSWIGFLLGLIPKSLLFLLLCDLFYLQQIWPDWEELAVGKAPVSGFMWAYLGGNRPPEEMTLLKWEPVPLSRIPAPVQQAFIVAEDGRFYQHSGLDWTAVEYAFQSNLRLKSPRYGASTISQQTVKNLFLSPSKTLLRKWHEMILTRAMEQHLSKRRILEIYLNIAQLGQGIFGVQAAAVAYWGRPVYRLTGHQGAELAATLPSPATDNPATRTPAFLRRTADISRKLEQLRR